MSGILTTYNSSQWLTGCLPWRVGMVAFQQVRSFTDQVAGLAVGPKHFVGRRLLEGDNGQDLGASAHGAQSEGRRPVRGTIGVARFRIRWDGLGNVGFVTDCLRIDQSGLSDRAWALG